MDTIRQNRLFTSSTVNSPSETQGIVYRGFRGEADYPNILALIEASKKADGVQRSDTLEDVARNYAHLFNCDPFQDMLFAEVEGKVAGYIRAWWIIDAEGKWLGSTIAFVDPVQRRKGIGAHLLAFAEERLSEISRQLIAQGKLSPTAPRLFDAFISESEVDKEALFVKAGYKAVRYAFDMVRPDLENIQIAPMPAGLEVRLVQPDEYRKVWDASQEAFQDHWGFVRQPEEEYFKWLEDSTFDPTIWKVAWDGDQVAGMVLNFISEQENEEYGRKRGYTENICVRRPYRRQGLARSLIAQSLHELKRRGMQEAALGVDAENISGALHLYESSGFQVVKRSTIYRKPVEN